MLFVAIRRAGGFAGRFRGLRPVRRMASGTHVYGSRQMASRWGGV